MASKDYQLIVTLIENELTKRNDETACVLIAALVVATDGDPGARSEIVYDLIAKYATYNCDRIQGLQKATEMLWDLLIAGWLEADEINEARYAYMLSIGHMGEGILDARMRLALENLPFEKTHRLLQFFGTCGTWGQHGSYNRSLLKVVAHAYIRRSSIESVIRLFKTGLKHA